MSLVQSVRSEEIVYMIWTKNLIFEYWMRSWHQGYWIIGYPQHKSESERSTLKLHCKNQLINARIVLFVVCVNLSLSCLSDNTYIKRELILTLTFFIFVDGYNFTRLFLLNEQCYTGIVTSEVYIENRHVLLKINKMPEYSGTIVPVSFWNCIVQSWIFVQDVVNSNFPKVSKNLRKIKERKLVFTHQRALLW